MTRTPKQDVEFGLMSTEDLAEVIELERAAFGDPWTEKAFQEELRNPVSRVLLMRLTNRQLIGFAVYWLVADEIQILHVAVSPAHRRQGYGKTLMETILDYGRANGYAIATLEYRASNVAAAKLYANLGFTVLSVRPAYYKDNKEDAILSELKLKDSAAF